MTFAVQAQDYTLGVGVYPGDPQENFAPFMRIDSTTYRNLALHRPAYHSSSYDYNLTAQLVTDGIKETALPGGSRRLPASRVSSKRTNASGYSMTIG